MHERQDTSLNYNYRPIESNPNAHLGEVPHPDYHIVTVDTPKVGIDGLREALKRKHGQRAEDTETEQTERS